MSWSIWERIDKRRKRLDGWRNKRENGQLTKWNKKEQYFTSLLWCMIRTAEIMERWALERAACAATSDMHYRSKDR